MAVPDSRARGLRIAGFVLLGAAALFAYLVWVGHARVGADTISLVAVSGALLLCLRAMFRIVQALGRADVQTVVEHATDLGIASDRELREEKRRLLRAINELKFDHEMGKLSKADYDTVREGYELRAIEVMRALDAGATLHPELAARIGDPAAKKAGEPASGAPVEAEPAAATSKCASCNGSNDVDAKFCKHCGKELAA
ncbi:MAG TPA: zinc ribbon domain-containing protein [Nannocystaceae bacterium]|nr:zinc ribbon domain-containing protein [Nannocystaceae bacterium]